ncbi:MAG: hydrogenase maturation protease [Dictyoglomaceae bacterium]
MKKIILVGFGNEYRRDDGLGIKLLDYFENIQKIKVQELAFDLAENLKDYDIVIFSDAAIEGDDVAFRKIEKEEKFSPLTHHMTCEELLIWISTLYHKEPEFYLLSMKGYDFDFGEEFSEKARENLEKGVKTLEEFLKNIWEKHID